MENENNASGKISNSYTYARMLFLADLLREPAIRAAIQALNFSTGSRGLDAACGIGHRSLWLADAVGPTGHVTGMDLSSEFIKRAKEDAQKLGMSDRVTFQEGDLTNLPFEDNTFDWVWTVDAAWVGSKEIGCAAEEPSPLVQEFVRVVRPGGIVAILFWSSQKLLPGFPLLEARLNTTSYPTAPFTKGMPSAYHCLRALGWLRDAGLENPAAQTFVADVHAPLGDDMRNALTMTFHMFWGEVQSEITPEDWAEFQRLCQPESPDFILNCSDYYAFLTYSLFHARVSK